MMVGISRARRVFIVYTLAIVCMLLTASAGDVALTKKERNALLTLLEKDLSGLKTLRVSFDQIKRLSLFDEDLTSKGIISFTNPGKIRFETIKPFNSILIVNGKNVAKYERSNGKWKRLKVRNGNALALVMHQIGNWLRGDFRSQSTIFSVNALKRDGVTILSLKSKPARFAKVIERIEIELAADRSRFVAIVIYEPGGDYTKLKFAKEVRNESFADGTFDVDRDEPVTEGIAKK